MTRSVDAVGEFSARSGSIEATVLLACLHLDRGRLDESGIDTLTPAQWDRVVTLAGYQRVRPLLHQRLWETGRWSVMDEPSWQRLRHECSAIATRKLHLHAELSRIVSAFASEGIATIALKGAFLGPVVYNNVALREMNDLDLMVPRPQLADAVRAVLRLGYTELDAFPRNWDDLQSHHATLTKARTGVVEIHWTIAPMDVPITLTVEELWTRALPSRAAHAEAQGLSPVDLLLHLCVHASYQHQYEFGLRPSCDLQRVLSFYGEQFDWDEFLRSGERWKCAHGAALSLSVAQELVGIDIPKSVARRLVNVQSMLPCALDLAWVAPIETRTFHPSLTSLSDGTPWEVRLRSIRERILVTRDELRRTHGTRVDAWWWRALYLRRLFVLSRQHLTKSIGMVTGWDRSANLLAQKRNRMRRWLWQP